MRKGDQQAITQADASATFAIDVAAKTVKVESTVNEERMMAAIGGKPRRTRATSQR